MNRASRTALALAAAAILLAAAAPARAMNALEAVNQLATQIVRMAPADGEVKFIVTDFADSHGVISDFSRYVADRLILRMAQDPRFLAVERTLLKTVLRQMKLKEPELGSPEKATLVAKKFGADILVVGSSTDMGNVVSVEAKVIGSETGDIVGYASANVAKDKKVLEMLEIGK